jgi:tRNA(Ile2) C34 agmatinyltransferase TiaS
MDLHKTTFQPAAANDHPLFKNLERCIMTDLQEQVLKTGTCPECHKKTLSDGYSGGGMSFKHCKCGHTWVVAL